MPRKARIDVPGFCIMGWAGTVSEINACLDGKTRWIMAELDFSLAEQSCPQQMAIGRLIRKGLTEFT